MQATINMQTHTCELDHVLRRDNNRPLSSIRKSLFQILKQSIIHHRMAQRQSRSLILGMMQSRICEIHTTITKNTRLAPWGRRQHTQVHHVHFHGRPHTSSPVDLSFLQNKELEPGEHYDCPTTLTVARTDDYTFNNQPAYYVYKFFRFPVTVTVTVEKDCSFKITGHPVVLFSGEKQERVTDLDLANPDVEWSFQRFYGSQTVMRSMLGYRWATN